MFQKSLVLLTALLASTAFAPPASASSVTSHGFACDGDFLLEPVCARATFETWWSDCGYSASYGADTCRYQHALTLRVSANHCGIVAIYGYGSLSFCASSEDHEFTAYYPWVYELESYVSLTFDLTVCLDTTDLSSPQCARWYHVTSPAPGQGVPDEDDRSRLDSSFWSTYYVASTRTQEGVLPVGATVYDLP